MWQEYKNQLGREYRDNKTMPDCFKDRSADHFKDYICVYVEQFILETGRIDLLTEDVLQDFAACKHKLVCHVHDLCDALTCVLVDPAGPEGALVALHVALAHTSVQVSSVDSM